MNSMVETRKGLVLYGVLFLIICLGLVQIIQTTQSTILFFLESAGLLFFLFLVLLGFIGAGKKWGQNLFFTVFLFSLLNLVVGWWFLRGTFFGFLVVIAVFGLILSIIKKNPKSVKKSIVEEVRSIGFDEPKDSKVEKVAEAKVIKLKRKTDPKAETVAEAKIVKLKTYPKSVKDKKDQTEKKTSSIVSSPIVKHFPGKFVASKNSNVYHAPKCEWAKKIAKTRRLWFASQEEAWEKGYKGHTCIQ